jgi:pyruvate dehydrogenase phosphatase
VTSSRGVRTVARRPSSSHRRTGSGSSAAAAALPASPMHLRSLSAGLVAAAVAGGAWYYKALTPLHADSGQSSTRYDLAGGDDAGARKALLVEDGQIFTTTITDNGPLLKNTDGRRMLEMLTPDQATLKLRKNEESWFIGRGKGVVRYDVVQIPSNDPIEDDHAEKIIQVPDTVAATGDGSNSSDWMFWGVFDGHRWVLPTTV